MRFQPLWRAHSDAVNRALLERWLPDGGARRALKTDLFDEAVAQGLYPVVAREAESFVGIDVSDAVLTAVRSRYPDMDPVRADVRRLRFTDGEFDLVVSLSTLDHFRAIEELEAGLRELHRVLEPGGLLVLTLDNRTNPVIALRNALPFGPLNRLGVLPYYVGATCGPRRLRRVLAEVGFRVLEVDAVMHCPRVLAVPLAAAIERLGRDGAATRFLRILRRFESLSGLPTRFLTGHFVAVRAVRV